MAENGDNKIEYIEIPVCQILKKIQNNDPVRYDHVRIVGDLDLNELDLPTENIERIEPVARKGEKLEKIRFIKSKITIMDSIIGNLNFEGAIFDKGITFRGSQFEYANFRGSQFRNFADFMYVKFNHADGKGYANFREVQFCGEAIFYVAEFDKVNFLNAQFNGNANFQAALFFKFHAIFEGTKFSRTSDFSKSRFNASASFDKAQFYGDVFFDESKFLEGASFGKAQFKGVVSFNKSQFSDFKQTDICFEGTQFDLTTDFNNSQFFNNANFSGAKFLDDVTFENTNFEAKLLLNKAKYKKLYIRWRDMPTPGYQSGAYERNHKSENPDYEDATFLLLIENFKNLGFFEDADNCYYCYRKQRLGDLSGIYKLFDWILGLSYGYGVKPLKPLMWFFIFFLVFGLLYATFPNVIGFANSNSTSPIDAFIVSSQVFLSGTKLVDNPDYISTGIPLWIFTIEKLTASLFFAMFLISFSRTIIR